MYLYLCLHGCVNVCAVYVFVSCPCNVWYVACLQTFMYLCRHLWVFVDVLCIVCCMDVAWMYVLYKHLFIHVDACMVYAFILNINVCRCIVCYVLYRYRVDVGIV